TPRQISTETQLTSILLTLRPTPAQIQSTPTDSPSYLLKVEYRYTSCVYISCYGYAIFYRDGTVSQSDEPGIEAKRQIDGAIIAALSSLLETTDLAAIRAVKFTGVCPTARGGQETIYTFYRSTGPEIISNCQFAIDYKIPLFGKINELLVRIGIGIPYWVPASPTPSATPIKDP